MGIKITHISDTHGVHNQLRFGGGDVLIHTGDIFDFKNRYSESSILGWFEKLPYRYKIIVQGNHDNFNGYLPHDTYILNNRVLNLDGLKIYGLSAVLPEKKSSKQYNVSSEFDILMGLNQNNVDILATHGSPKGILDIKKGISVGSESLLRYVKKIKPMYHLFGHSHHSIGIHDDGDTKFVNNSIVKNVHSLQIQSKPLDIFFKN